MLLAAGAVVVALAAAAASRRRRRTGASRSRSSPCSAGRRRSGGRCSSALLVLAVAASWRRALPAPSAARARPAAVLLLEAGAGILLSRAVDSSWLPFDDHLLSRWGFPELRIAWTTGVLVVAARSSSGRSGGSPRRSSRSRRSPPWCSARPSRLRRSRRSPSDWAPLPSCAWCSAPPPACRRRSAFAPSWPRSGSVARSPPGRTAADRLGEYVGTDAAGKAIRVRVLGRDAQDTQRLARRWRQLAYRDPRRSVAVGRVEQVEHEAVATLLAAQAGVRVPEVVTAALAPTGDALIVTRRADTDPVERSEPGDVSDALLHQLWAEVSSLHAAGISHGRLNPRTSRSSTEHRAGRPLRRDPRRAEDGDRHRRRRAARRVHGARRARACAADGLHGAGRPGCCRGAALHGARRAHAAPARPGPRSRRRAQEAPRGGRRADRTRAAGHRARPPRPGARLPLHRASSRWPPIC